MFSGLDENTDVSRVAMCAFSLTWRIIRRKRPVRTICRPTERTSDWAHSKSFLVPEGAEP